MFLLVSPVARRLSTESDFVQRAEDLGIDKRDATRDLLAAKNMKDLVRASGGLYVPPRRFRNW